MIFEECDFHISSIVSMISIGSISSSCLEKAGLKPRGVLDASRFGAGSQKGERGRLGSASGHIQVRSLSPFKLLVAIT